MPPSSINVLFPTITPIFICKLAIVARHISMLITNQNHNCQFYVKRHNLRVFFPFCYSGHQLLVLGWKPMRGYPFQCLRNAALGSKTRPISTHSCRKCQGLYLLSSFYHLFFLLLHRFLFLGSFANISHRSCNLCFHRVHLVCGLRRAAGRGLRGRTPTLAGFSASERFPLTFPFCFSHPSVSERRPVKGLDNNPFCFSYSPKLLDRSLSSLCRTSSTYSAPILCRGSRGRSWSWGGRPRPPVSIRACWLAIP